MTITDIRDRYRQSASLRSLAQQLTKQAGAAAPRHLGGLSGSQRQFVLAALAEATRRGLLVVVNDREEALYVQNDLERMLPERSVLLFPAPGKRPYETQEIDNANVLQRTEVLNHLQTHSPEQAAIVSYPEALAERVVTRQAVAKNTLHLQKGEEVGMEFVLEMLEEYGFESATFVHEPGQYASRGGIVDIYSFASDYPVRIEFLGDEVDTLRSFDPASQLSREHLEAIDILPNLANAEVHETRISILEYLPPTVLLAIEDVEFCADELRKVYQRALHAFEEEHDSGGDIRRSAPDALFLRAEPFLEQLATLPVLEIGHAHYFNAETVQFTSTPQPQFKKDFERLGKHLEENAEAGIQNVICFEQENQHIRLREILEATIGEANFEGIEVPIHHGFLDRELGLACYTDHEIFERYYRYRTREVFQRGKALTLKQLTELQPGDYVTHVQHGIGRFAGLETIEAGENKQEAVKLIYRDNDVVYISINALHKISKYSGQDGAQPKLSKLGSGEWERKKSKVKKRVKRLAFDLIELYAKRKAQKGTQFSADDYMQQELEASFLYEDTPDQETATQAVKQDMEAEFPMDRLVCGDVGFGKTEVAIRAAFKAVNDGKQAAVLVPTTILAMQHYQTFLERLEQFPVNIDFVNRFRSTKEIKDILNASREGKVDILIGTHRLLSKDVEFKDLGLLIIDEEHKFGVASKEKLRLKRVNVDTLTLTATPIPRTLQFSLLGIRDMSVISTPPPNRQPVETSIQRFDSEVIRDAIAYEMKRQGQVFFVHNRVKDLDDMAGMIKKLVPDARIAIAHGQMPGENIEHVMMDFIERRYDVLVCTTIIESGLDIPNANTIIINQANMYGLSDLHQMRGRVGRSNRKAFCYLVAPPLSGLPKDARKRLTALVEFNDLGGGIQIAMRDLDIRGAGDILGAEQSGFITELGYDIYNRILQEAIAELKQEHFADTFDADGPGESSPLSDVQFDSDLELLIPQTYIPNVAERLSYYQRISEAATEEDLQTLAREMIDRFGMMPEPLLALLDSIRGRELAKHLGFARVMQKNGQLRAYFPKDPDDPFFQSERFNRLLDYLKEYPNAGELKQVRSGLVLKLHGKAATAKDALLILRTLHAHVFPQEEESLVSTPEEH